MLQKCVIAEWTRNVLPDARCVKDLKESQSHDESPTMWQWLFYNGSVKEALQLQAAFHILSHCCWIAKNASFDLGTPGEPFLIFMPNLLLSNPNQLQTINHACRYYEYCCCPV